MRNKLYTSTKLSALIVNGVCSPGAGGRLVCTYGSIQFLNSSKTYFYDQNLLFSLFETFTWNFQLNLTKKVFLVMWRTEFSKISLKSMKHAIFWKSIHRVRQKTWRRVLECKSSNLKLMNNYEKINFWANYGHFSGFMIFFTKSF